MTGSLRPDASPDTSTGRLPSPTEPPGEGPPDASVRSGPGLPKAKAREKERDSYFDNAKYLAIVLVALGHSWEPLRDESRAASALYMMVYAMHMPAFIIISGYFSRTFDMRADRLQRLVTGVLVPYLIFETAYSLFKRVADDDPGHRISILDPWYLTWFLIALFVWRMTTPIWKIVRWPIPIALAIAMGASMVTTIGNDLDMQRVLQFMPFFVVGLCMRPHHFRLLHSRRGRLLSIPVFLASCLIAYWAVPRMTAAWFYRRDSAPELGAPAWSGAVMTLAMFGCSVVLCACFFAWVPRRRMVFTVLGTGTLYGYLLHGFVAKGSRFWGWYDHAWIHTPYGAVVVTVAAASLITVLCTPPVRRTFRWAMEPKMTWFFRRDLGKVMPPPPELVIEKSNRHRARRAR